MRKLSHSGPSRNHSIVAVLASAGLSASLVQTLVIPIQPELPVLLNAPGDQTLWIVTVTLISGAISTPIAGRLGDMYGKRRIAMILLLVLTTGCLVSALSSSLVPMLMGRVLQGGGVGVIPLGISILRDVLPPHRLGSSIALVSATLGIGGALGLPLAGLIAQHLDWHAIFWTAGAIALVTTLLCWVVVPDTSLRTPGRLDVVGIVGLSIGLVCLLVGLSRGSIWGWADARTLGLLGGGVVTITAWVLFELRVSDPLVNLRVSMRGTVLMTNLATLAMGFALFASNVVFPQLLQLPRATGIGARAVHRRSWSGAAPP